MKNKIGDFEIVRVSGNQLVEIEILAKHIWPISYKEMISGEQIEYMLNRFYSLDALKIQSKSQEFYVVKDVTSQTVAFFSIEHNEGLEKTKLHKIYVDPENCGLGIGKIIIQFVEKEARSAGFVCVFLNVNKHNKAVSFYEHLNFKIVKEEIIDIESGFVMDDFVLEKMI